MRAFLNGGGDGPHAAEAYRRFGEKLDKSKPLLYVPLAMEPSQYPDCLTWVTGELASLHVEIRMVTSGEELAGLVFTDFCGIFIGGGNTYRLLHTLKASGSLEKIREYLQSGGVVFGGSAGAIVLGENIDTCKYADENAVGLKDTRVLDVLGGVSLLCHYTNEGEEITRKHTEHLLALSREGRRILALPEENTIILESDACEMVGTRPYYYFVDGARRCIHPEENITKILAGEA